MLHSVQAIKACCRPNGARGGAAFRLNTEALREERPALLFVEEQAIKKSFRKQTGKRVPDAFVSVVQQVLVGYESKRRPDSNEGFLGAFPRDHISHQSSARCDAVRLDLNSHQQFNPVEF